MTFLELSQPPHYFIRRLRLAERGGGGGGGGRVGVQGRPQSFHNNCGGFCAGVEISGGWRAGGAILKLDVCLADEVKKWSQLRGGHQF
jgi:hypothetical protein